MPNVDTSTPGEAKLCVWWRSRRGRGQQGDSNVRGTRTPRAAALGAPQQHQRQLRKQAVRAQRATHPQRHDVHAQPGVEARAQQDPHHHRAQ
jgi:hypothetical protein